MNQCVPPFAVRPVGRTCRLRDSHEIFCLNLVRSSGNDPQHTNGKRNIT
jgi:hypothetical protein